MLQKASVPYEKIDAEENAQLAKQYGIKQAPSLVVVHGDGYDKYVNASNIKSYISGI